MWHYHCPILGYNANQETLCGYFVDGIYRNGICRPCSGRGLYIIYRPFGSGETRAENVIDISPKPKTC